MIIRDKSPGASVVSICKYKSCKFYQKGRIYKKIIVSNLEKISFERKLIPISLFQTNRNIASQHSILKVVR